MREKNSGVQELLREFSESIFSESILGIGPQDFDFGNIGVGDSESDNVDQIALSKLQHPETDDTRITITLSENGIEFTARRIGKVVEHVGLDGLPENVKGVLTQHQRFGDKLQHHRDETLGLQKKIAKLTERADCYEDVAQGLMRLVIPREAQQRPSPLTLRATQTGFEVNDANGDHICNILNDQGIEICAAEEEAESLRAQKARLGDEIVAIMDEAVSITKPGHKILNLASLMFIEHLEEKGHKVEDISIYMKSDGTDGVFAVIFEVDEDLGTFAVTHLPDDLLAAINKPAITIASYAKEKVPAGTFMTDEETPADSEGNGAEHPAEKVPERRVPADVGAEGDTNLPPHED